MSTRAQQKEQTQQNILQAALEMFARDGFERATIANIARQAGVSKGLIHHHFPTKRDLILATIRQRSEHMQALMVRAPEDASPAERLSWFARAMLEEVASDPTNYRLYLRAMTDEATRDLIQESTAPAWTQAFEAMGSQDAAHDAQFFRACLLGLLTTLATSHTPPSIEPMLQRLNALLP